MYRYSGITVKEFLELSSMKDAKVLAGGKGLERNITRLNVMEVPDIINWVEKGEFLLTTAYSIKDNIEELDDLITQLNSKGVAGLGIKTKRYIKEIPKASLQKAENLNFPLIDIPFDISYSTILGEGLTEIVDAHTNTLSRIGNIQNKLINVMLSGGSLKEIATAIHESIDGNTVVIKEYIIGTCVILSDKDKRKSIEAIVEEEGLKRKDIKEKYSYQNAYSKSIDIFEGKEINRISIPIYSENIEYGCVYIWEDKRFLSPVELKVIESATPIIALDIHKKMSILEIESKDKTEFLKDLFSGKEDRLRKAIDRASYFDFDINNSYSVIVIYIKNIDIYEKYKSNVPNYIHQLKVKLLSIIQRIAKNGDYKVISTARNDSIIVLFSSEADKNEAKVKDDIKSFCDQILYYSEHEHFNDYIYIGIGRNYNDPKKIWESNKEAIRVIDYQKSILSERVVYYDDLGIYRILSFEGLQLELNHFYKEMLDSLVIYDKEKGTDLILTLKNYFESEGNLKKISEKMFLHYNTVVYRLQRIKEITGMNLENYEDRLNLQIALKIFDMQG